MTRNLRLLERHVPRTRAMQRAAQGRLLFASAVAAILVQFFLSYVVLDALGFSSQTVKVHPSTVIALMGAGYALFCGMKPFSRRCKEDPGLVLYVVMVPVLAIYSVYWIGYSGSAIFPDTFWSAGLLAIILDAATPAQRRWLAKLLIALCVFNVAVALYESFTLTMWFPLVFDPDKLAQSPVATTDFRPNAFFDHPLTASLVTAMAIFMLLGMDVGVLSGALIFGALVIGLFVYGGRTALGVTVIIIPTYTLLRLLTGVVRRNLSLRFVVMAVSGAIVLPLIITFIVTQTHLADRIMDTLYFDGSAQVRATQWDVFSLLSLRNWLFGISHDDLNVLKYQMGLGGVDTDIENFWILMLLNLGVIGFAVFVVVLLLFLRSLARKSGSLFGWLLVISALIIDSGSNSLGSKSSDLFLEVAFIYGLAGYAGYRRPSFIRARRLARLGLIRPDTSLETIPPSRSRALYTSNARFS